MIEIKVSVMNVEKYTRAIDAIQEDMQDLTGMWPKMISLLERIEHAQFFNEGIGPSGHWAALDERYARQKEKLFPGEKILSMTHTLWASLTDSLAQGSVREFSEQELQFGSDIEYAGFHQYGTSVMPARPPIDLGSEHFDLISEVIADYVSERAAERFE